MQIFRPHHQTGVDKWKDWKVPGLWGPEQEEIYMLSPELLATISSRIARVVWNTSKTTISSQYKDLIGPQHYMDWYHQMFEYYSRWGRAKCHQRAVKALQEFYRKAPKQLNNFAPKARRMSRGAGPGVAEIPEPLPGSPP